MRTLGGVREQNDDSNVQVEETSSYTAGNKPSQQISKPEPPKDYIHFRARRGQATDSHSLAGRARREKISEKIKILHDLVPGCNKFLSIKLEAVNSRMNPAKEEFPSKDLEAQIFDATVIIFSQQAPSEYAQGTQHEWLHTQVGSSFERAM